MLGIKNKGGKGDVTSPKGEVGVLGRSYGDSVFEMFSLKKHCKCSDFST